MALYKLKVTFTASALDYGSSSVDNSLKAEGLSKTSSGDVAIDATLSLDGAMASAASSGFASAQRITITNATDESNGSSGAKYVIVGTDASSKSQTVTIQGGAAGKTVTTAESFKTVSSITVKQGVTNKASAGIASILEGDTGNNKSATYTITATDLTDGKTLTLNLGSTITAAFDYGTSIQSTSRDFKRDDDLIAANHAQTSSALTLTTKSFSSEHAVTLTSTGNDSGITWTIVGTNAAGPVSYTHLRAHET